MLQALSGIPELPNKQQLYFCRCTISNVQAVGTVAIKLSFWMCNERRCFVGLD